MASILIPKDYGYVVLTVTGTFFLGIWHGARIPGFRKPAGDRMNHPKAFADNADLAAASSPEQKKAMHLFNCAQRAHANFIENHSMTVLSILISGLYYPITASVLGLIWSVFRVIYAVGYTSPTKENGRGRLIGMPWSYVELGLFGLTGFTGYKMLQARW